MWKILLALFLFHHVQAFCPANCIAAGILDPKSGCFDMLTNGTTVVGRMCVSLQLSDPFQLTVTLQVPGLEMLQSDLWVSSSPAGVPFNGAGEPVFEKFSVSTSHAPATASFTYNNLALDCGKTKQDCTGLVYIAAHAILSDHRSLWSSGAMLNYNDTQSPTVSMLLIDCTCQQTPTDQTSCHLDDQLFLELTVSDGPRSCLSTLGINALALFTNKVFLQLFAAGRQCDGPILGTVEYELLGSNKVKATFSSETGVQFSSTRVSIEPAMTVLTHAFESETLGQPGVSKYTHYLTLPPPDAGLSDLYLIASASAWLQSAGDQKVCTALIATGFSAIADGKAGSEPYHCEGSSCPSACCLPPTLAYSACLADPRCKFVDTTSDAEFIERYGTSKQLTGGQQVVKEGWISEACLGHADLLPFEAPVANAVGESYPCEGTLCEGACCLPEDVAMQRCLEDPVCKYVDTTDMPEFAMNFNTSMQLSKGERIVTTGWSSRMKKESPPPKSQGQEDSPAPPKSQGQEDSPAPPESQDSTTSLKGQDNTTSTSDVVVQSASNLAWIIATSVLAVIIPVAFFGGYFLGKNTTQQLRLDPFLDPEPQLDAERSLTDESFLMHPPGQGSFLPPSLA